MPMLPLLLLLGTSPVVYVMLRSETPDDTVAPPPAPKRPHPRPRAPPPRPDPRPNKQIADLAERARRERERAKAEPVADVGLPPMYGGPATKPKPLGLERCAAFRATQGPRGRPAVAGLFNTGTNFLMKLLRMNCDFPDACPAQPHIKVDKDNPYEAEIRIMAEMQLARRHLQVERREARRAAFINIVEVDEHRADALPAVLREPSTVRRRRIKSVVVGLVELAASVPSDLGQFQVFDGATSQSTHFGADRR